MGRPSEVKLKKVEEYLGLVDLASLALLPVKKFGETVFFVNGHRGAFAPWGRGIREIVCWDNDDRGVMPLVAKHKYYTTRAVNPITQKQ
ncbi:MAG: hypothetical protein GX322_03840 [Firmicutes bacterium]|nr:hypothetical protein [Bacillota bacterium]